MSTSERRSSVRTGIVWDAVVARLADNARIVDIGGGTGGFAVRLAERGHAVTVVDPSPDVDVADLQQRFADERRRQASNRQRMRHHLEPVRLPLPGVQTGSGSRGERGTTSNQERSAGGTRHYLANGSGLNWNLTTLLVVPFPVSMWNGVRVLTVAHRPFPFHPAFASSIRPSIHFV